MNLMQRILALLIQLIKILLNDQPSTSSLNQNKWISSCLKFYFRNKDKNEGNKFTIRQIFIEIYNEINLQLQQKFMSHANFDKFLPEKFMTFFVRKLGLRYIAFIFYIDYLFLKISNFIIIHFTGFLIFILYESEIFLLTNTTHLIQIPSMNLNKLLQNFTLIFQFKNSIFPSLKFISSVLQNDLKFNMKKNHSSQRTVYEFLSPIKMKFKSTLKGGDVEANKSSIFSKITSFSWINGESRSGDKSSSPQKYGSSKDRAKSLENSLKFIKKLSNEHFLVGNQYKVDIMCLGGIVENFIDTEYIRSMDFKKSILNIAVDIKSIFFFQIKECLIAFLIPNQVLIYQYNLKKTNEPPILLTNIKTTGQVRFIQFAKFSFLALFYENNMEIYEIDETSKTSKKRLSKHYNQPEGAKLFEIPQAFEGVINMFFTQPKVDTAMFHLWNLEVKLQKDEIVLGSFLKIYDIPNGLKSKMVLSNYCKEIFCINLGHQILAVKKGYIIDTVNSNIENNAAVLRYLGNDKLIHILKHKIQMYRFSINMTLNPPRIVLESTDSIWSKMNDENYFFLEVLQMLNDNIVVFYQLDQTKNNPISPEIKYAFNVTQKVKLQDKIKSILPSPEDLEQFKNNPDKKISNQNLEVIEEKVDMAMKMGLTRRQIYLKIWNSSPKCDIADYQFLLNTLNYDTIRAEIEKKLKKKSMVLRQIIKIEEGCISMLQNKVFGSEVCLQSLKNYLISHFLLRKLKLYQMFSLIQKTEAKNKKSNAQSSQHQPQSQPIMINIKDYIFFSKCDLKALLLELIRDFCFNNKNTILKIRTLVKLFKFSFRPIYSNLLQDLIKEAGSNLLLLLQAIPQVLPYQHLFPEQVADYSLYEGIWGTILAEQWDSNLYVGGISNIQNKQIVQEMKKSVWAKRFFLTLHDLLPYQKAQIQEIHERNKAEQTFYNFIEKVFYYIKEKQILRDLIGFIENNYEKLPRHLVGHIFLYKALFDYLSHESALKPIVQRGQLNQFLRLKDFEIFKLIFDLEKRKKNCILKDVKEGIYSNEQLVVGGRDIFNLGLLNYFSSELSGISDIKYLLNRLNNQKQEFHSQHQGMYEVIVKGMQAKLYLGGEKDIPISEVYIYISNIHINSSEIKKDLRYLQVINKHTQLFQKIRLNMNVFQIIQEVEKVLAKIINFEVTQRRLLEKNNDNEIITESIALLETTQKVKREIYFETTLENNLVLFVFLTIILQKVNFIPKVRNLLKSLELGSLYSFDQRFIQNVVIYMYKKKFSQDKIYNHNQIYINQLLTLLDETNQTRMFMSYEVELGITLSCDGNLIEYPIGGQNAILSTVELESAINYLPGSTIKNIDFDRIFQMSLKIQEISSNGKISSITLYQIYEIVILRLFECKMIKESIPFIRKIMQINPMNSHNFIFPAMLIKKFSCELCEQNRAILLLILTYQFSYPEQLLDIVEKLLNTKCTSQQQKITLKEELKRIQGSRKIYEKENIVLNKQYLRLIQSQTEQNGYVLLLRNSLAKVLSLKEQFIKNAEYTIIYTILLNNPYGIVKYLYCARYQTNFKAIRCFLTHLQKIDIFTKSVLLELGMRIFIILYEGLSQTQYIENIIDRYIQLPLNNPMDVKNIKTDSNLGEVISKSVQRFKSKLKQETSSKRKKAVEETQQNRKTKIKKLLSGEHPELEYTPGGYTYADSDNELTAQETRLKKIVTNQITNVQFDSIFQTQHLLGRNTNQLGIYLSQQHSVAEKKAFYCKKNQSLEIRNSILKLKKKKSQLEQEYNFKMSRRLIRKTTLSGNPVQVYTTLKHTNSSDFALELVDLVVKNVNLGEDSLNNTTQPVHDEFLQNILQKKIKQQSQNRQIQEQQSEQKQSPYQQLSQQSPNRVFSSEQNILLSTFSEKNIEVKANAQLGTAQEIKIVDQFQVEPNSQLPAYNYDSIFQKILSISIGQNFNLSPIVESKFDQQQLKDLICQLYNSNKFSSSQSISIIKKISTTMLSPVNKNMIDAFVKIESFQKKFSLQIDLKNVFSIEGLFLQSTDLNQLYILSRQKIIHTLNQSNVYKINKVLSLVFKNSQIEQELNVAFLMKLLQQFQSFTLTDTKQLKMQKEKIKAFTEKISPQQLNQKDESILNAISNPALKKELVNIIAQTMRKKRNEDMSQNFLEKWNQ